MESGMNIHRTTLKARFSTEKARVAIWFVALILLAAPVLAYSQERTHDDLFSVNFPNDRDGWACGRWGTVIHTTDGGKTWTRQNTGTNSTLMSIMFVDKERGWAVGDTGTILHTSNGGRTWEQQKSPVAYYLMGVFFITPLKGWIVTERTHILQTSDGGKTWNVQFKDADYILKSISFSDPLNGWVVGEYGYVYHTRNGGATWEKQGGFFGLSDNDEIVADPYLFSVAALDPRRAWAVGIDGYVRKTQDGGTTWQTVDVGAPKTHLFCVRSNGKNAIVIAGRGALLCSEDGGTTWKSAETAPSAKYGWFYGIGNRGSSGFVAVGWNGMIYESSSLRSWKNLIY
jgi:photosystem II stability/assembly factor-like uncharacterized protein